MVTKKTVFRALGAAAALWFFAAWLAPAVAGAEQRKQIPRRVIPKKRIPKEVTYRQAPAFTKGERRNRKLVQKARGAGRRLKRGGTATAGE